MPNYRLFIVAFCILHSVFLLPPSFAGERVEVIRVAIFRGPELNIGGRGLSVTGTTGSKERSVRTSVPLVLKKSRDGIVVAGKEYTSLRIEADNREIEINGRRYRGDVDILRDKSDILVVNQLFLEEYLVGVINQEISSKWPMESVKAQAVVARTYALYQKRNGKDPRYDLESTVKSQVYGGLESEDELARKAVSETEREVIYYNGEIIQSLYHSSCGGKTEAAAEVWGKEVPYLRSIKDPHCIEAPNYFWQYNIGLNELRARLMSLNGEIGKIETVSIVKKSTTGRVTGVSVRHSGGSTVIPGKDFREAIGFENIRSTDFTLKIKGESVYFAGSGGGHGVGMCQWGAKGMAEEGKSYIDILNWYYPGGVVRKMSGK